MLVQFFAQVAHKVRIFRLEWHMIDLKRRESKYETHVFKFIVSLGLRLCLNSSSHFDCDMATWYQHCYTKYCCSTFSPFIPQIYTKYWGNPFWLERRVIFKKLFWFSDAFSKSKLLNLWVSGRLFDLIPLTNYQLSGKGSNCGRELYCLEFPHMKNE